MKRVQFSGTPLPYFFVLPQIAIVIVFFLWPAAQAVYKSFLLEDAWGLTSQFVWFRNYEDMVLDADWVNTAVFTVIFSMIIAFASLAIALTLAVRANDILRGASTYKTLLIWTYAVAPAVAGLIGNLLFNPLIGSMTHLLHALGWEFDRASNGFDAAFMISLIAVWKQVSVNFIFFLAGLQGISKSVQEAAILDCRSRSKRFWTITFPLLAPTTFFLLVINMTYAFFDTFGIIDTTTRGAPGGSTQTLVYKVYTDGFIGADLGGSSAQSVVLLLMVLVLTAFQFRFIERKVHY
ncbi:ABC transporter permease subunit [Rhodospirillaceae bacterium KN72]|uniref:sn-glycerol-3-phosphate transport system permease protein UgpA n=1 Tax=Pacificispira spongiicola TaxID=2729598 RepID=A0A7Y0HG10_9PROT|nr:ABC transporter permease subunit [Pacificispira spongiicola]NMM46401.1 ABC transporter permease subunit [Pacificispira spongiicola]